MNKIRNLSQKEIQKIYEMEKIIQSNRHTYPIDQIISEARKEKALDIIVKTILSQNTSDKLRDIAFSNLKKEFQDLRHILKEKPSKIQKLIKICGLPRVKTKRLKTSLKAILKMFPDPEEMRKEPEEKLFYFLSSIHGIGPKSASVIMAFLGFDAFPVDTHVSRIIKRLGIADGSRERIFKLVSPHIKDKIVSHLFLINHGRNICKARKPKCEICIFRKICNFYQKK